LVDVNVVVVIVDIVVNVSPSGTPYMHNYFEEGQEKGYFVRTSDGSVWRGYSDSVLVDLSNPNAYQWMVDIIFQVREKINFSFCIHYS